MLAALTLLASSSCCEAFVLGRVPFTPVATTARAPAETLSMNLFDNLSKIVDYNKKYFETALSSMFDDRTARASHVLFGFNKYGESGQAEAEALKSKIEAGEVAFANAAQEYSTCPSSAKGGDLGTFGKGAMVPGTCLMSWSSNIEQPPSC